MPVTLAQAKLNAVDAVDLNVIDEFRKSSFLLNALTFDDAVAPGGNASTLTYGYTRLATQPTAQFRAINSEYVPSEVTKVRASVDLKVLGGAFQIDRILDRASAAAETALQMNQKIKAATTLFHQSVILGDPAADANSFTGLSKILAGTSTEVNAGAVADWSAIDTKQEALAEIARVDEWLASLDERPDVIFGNRRALAKFKVIASWSDFIDKSTDAFGRSITAYDGIPLVDLGDRVGENNPIIPVESRTVGTAQTNLTDLYAVRFGLDGFHGVSLSGGTPLIRAWLPDFTTAGAVKTGEVELGPVAVALKRTKAASVLRNVKVA
jgi:hypothetical protein